MLDGPLLTLPYERGAGQDHRDHPDAGVNQLAYRFIEVANDISIQDQLDLHDAEWVMRMLMQEGVITYVRGFG